jgi:hypothetical protein
MIPIMAALVAAGPKVNLDGHTINGNTSGSESQAGVRINADGTVDQNDDGVFSQIDSATDWVIPNSLGGADYTARASVSGDALDAGSAAEDTDLALSTPRHWFVSDNTPTVGGKSATVTVTLKSAASGATLAVGVYTLTADREDS